NGGPHFKFNPAVSFIVNCDSKEEVEGLWQKLSEGGKTLMPLDAYPFSEKYGWCEDKFGLSWQLILSSPEGGRRPKIMPSMMFVGPNAGRAENAFKFYISIFRDSGAGQVVRYSGNEGADKEGTIMYADFHLESQWFAVMDSAFEHQFAFNEAISFIIDCESQEEVDHYWNRLSEGGDEKAQQCGWLKDKFGVSWQVVPTILNELLSSTDKEKSKRAMNAMLKMKKIEIEKLI
ncbi:MAG: VOC family protein, partial [Bacteroidota bacterium]|nr:VOC family protein [Bacteroidota bacterium]